MAEVPNSKKETTPPVGIVNLKKLNPGQVGYIQITPNNRGGLSYSTLISEAIYDIEVYIGLILALNNATENDDFIIKLASPGGSIETGIAICNAIYNCKARVVTQAIGVTASIAAVIWCCGKVRSLVPTAILMFHMPSGFGGGKTADLEEQSGFFQKYFKELLKNITTNILTDDEFEDMTAGRKDIFLPYDVLKDRLTKKAV